MMKRTPVAITVGATVPATDARWSSSNFGTCLDLFAPGVSILSAGIPNDSRRRITDDRGGLWLAPSTSNGQLPLCIYRDRSGLLGSQRFCCAHNDQLGGFGRPFFWLADGRVREACPHLSVERVGAQSWPKCLHRLTGDEGLHRQRLRHRPGLIVDRRSLSEGLDSVEIAG